MPAPSVDEALRLHRQQRFAEAEAVYRQWLADHPDDAEAWLRLGNTLIDLRRGDQALVAYQRHLAIAPSSAIGHTAMGNLLLAAERFDQAIPFHRRAVALKPDHAEGWHCLAVTLVRDGRVDEAVEAARRAVELRPNFPEARQWLALSLALRGDCAEGWEQRARLRPASAADWDGAPLKPASLLVQAETSVGETLLFARFLEAARQRVGRVVVECPPDLRGILSRTAGVDETVAAGTPSPSCQRRALIGDLPRLLQIPAAELGATGPYLHPDSKRAAALRKRIATAAKKRLKIGLAAVPFRLEPKDFPDAAFFALAPVVGAIELGIAGDDFDDLAATMAGLDLVIGGDGPLLHLAAGLGVPVWAALPVVPDWPWMLGRPDTPWHPTARLFRQVRRGDWSEPAAALAEALAEKLGAGAKRLPFAQRLDEAKTLHQQGRIAEAADRYRRGLASDPDHPELLHMLGLACHQMGQSSIGVGLIERAVALQPDYPDAWNNLGVALRSLGRLAEAIRCFEEATRLQPRYVDAFYNLGNARHAHRDGSEAEAAYRQAIAIDSRHVGAHYNLGNLLRDRHRLGEAIAIYRRAIALNPEDAEIHQSLALCLLLDGQYADGFAEFEWRWRTKGINRRDFPQPAWDGRPFPGQRLYVYAEQGLGDTLQFIRYIPRVKALGGEVIVEAQRSLLPLLARVSGIDALVPAGDPPPPFDLQVPLMSLPGLMGTRLETLSDSAPYLSADPARVRRWRPRLDAAAQGALKVGLVWAGSPAFRADGLRSPRLEACLPLFEVPFVQFFGLQLGDGRRDLDGRTLPSNFTDLGPEIADFEDTAAVMSELDLLISSCTAPVHLAGGLGVPTWVMLPHVPDWRWLLGRSDSPWYPSLRLFRQTEPERWGPMVDEVAGALRERGETSARNLNNLANRMKSTGRIEEALPFYRRAMAAAPNLPQIPYNFANALDALGRTAEAEAALRQALTLDPDHRSSLTNLGALLLRHQRADEAMVWFKKVCALEPDDPLAHYNLASALQAQGHNEAALVALDRALSLNPAMPMALNNKGACLRQLGRLDEAATLLGHAAEVNPGMVEIHNNLGLVFKDRGQIAQAIACHEKAVELAPNHVEAHWNLALASLLAGDFARGWHEYEWRWKSGTFTTPPRDWPMPEWQGEPLAGRRIIVHCEQGYGDSMQFVRYAPLLAETGARVILEAPPPLLRLFRSLDGIAKLITPDAPIPEADFHVPLLSLPLRFGTRLETIPARAAYLHADSETVAAWRQRLADLGGLRIGLAWSGDPRHRNDRNRSMPLEVLAPLIRRPGTSWVSVQKGPAAAQIAAADLPLRNLGPGLIDFADTAALLQSLDLVISVDTSVVHAAGALGRPVWILLPFAPDFRWLMNRDDSPWYPSARLFRQPQRGAWDAVAERLGHAVDELLNLPH